MEEITAEYESGTLTAAKPLTVRVAAQVACKTDMGRVRENNEDKLEFFIPSDDPTLATKGQIYLVCDGMGGAAAGQFASEIASKTFIDVYLNHPSSDPLIALAGAVSGAHRFVGDAGRSRVDFRGMGTTLSGLVLLEGKAYLAQVGDSRIYRLRGGAVEQLTEDHTWVDEAIKMGMITAKEAETHPYRHVLTRAIGGEGDVNPDIFTHALEVGDTFLLCSDGLTNHVTNEQIETVLGSHGPSEAAWKLVGMALQGGGSDNCTVLIVKILALELLEEPA